MSVGAVQYSTLYSALQHRVAARYIIDIITALHGAVHTAKLTSLIPFLKRSVYKNAHNMCIV